MRNLSPIVAAFICCAPSALPAQEAEPIARYVTVFTSDAWKSNPLESGLVDAVKRPPAGSPLENWTRGVAVKHFTPKDPTFARYANVATADRLPVVVVQRTDGGYVYKATGDNIPRDAYALGREIEYFAGLDPLNAKRGQMADSIDDSADARGRVEWLTEDDFCPDGRCPSQPRQPALQPRRPFVQVGPDSVDLQPSVDLSGMATPVMIGVVVLATIGLGFSGLVLLLILYVVYRLLTS